MEHFSSNGIEIAYIDIGEGEPILLIHGFASNHAVNWQATNWLGTLTGAGRRVIAMDVRGHGQSTKLYDPAAYSPWIMAEDAANLLDHLKLGDRVERRGRFIEDLDRRLLEERARDADPLALAAR